jgi:hypothetical protein
MDRRFAIVLVAVIIIAGVAAYYWNEANIKAQETHKAALDYSGSMDNATEQSALYNNLAASRPGDVASLDTWLTNMRSAADSSKSMDSAAIDSGRAYLAHLANGSADAAGVVSNETALQARMADTEKTYEQASSAVTYLKAADTATKQAGKLNDDYSSRPDPSGRQSYTSWVENVGNDYSSLSSAVAAADTAGSDYLGHLDQGSAEYASVSGAISVQDTALTTAGSRYEKENATLEQLVKQDALDTQKNVLNQSYLALPDTSNQTQFKAWLDKLRSDTLTYVSLYNDETASIQKLFGYYQSGSKDYTDLQAIQQYDDNNVKVFKDNYNNNAIYYNMYYQADLPTI